MRSSPAGTSGRRIATPNPPDGLPFITALRAVAALTILWHHFALYPPLATWAAPLGGELLDWLAVNGRTTQVFFVVGGFVMARSMGRRHWSLSRFGSYLIQRYCRLGLPYLAIVALILPVYWFARGWLPDDVVGQPVTWVQLLAHLFFLQDVLGIEPLSAGFWFICINLQLGMVFAAALLLRDTLGRGRFDAVGWLGWPAAIVSLFYWNLDPSWDAWWFYFFPYFFMGVVVQRALSGQHWKHELLFLQLVFAAAMLFDWRWRLLSAAAVAVLLWHALSRGYASRAPRSRTIAWLGRVSFSLFLVHFPVLVLVATIWARMGWASPIQGVWGLATAFGLSLMAADAFHRWVERPAASLGRRRLAPALPLAAMPAQGQRLTRG